MLEMVRRWREKGTVVMPSHQCSASLAYNGMGMAFMSVVSTLYGVTDKIAIEKDANTLDTSENVKHNS